MANLEETRVQMQTTVPARATHHVRDAREDCRALMLTHTHWRRLHVEEENKSISYDDSENLRFVSFLWRHQGQSKQLPASLLSCLVLFYNIVSETVSYYKIISIFMSKLLKSTKEEIPM